MKKILILLLLSVNCYAQDFDTLRFLDNIKEKIFKLKQHDIWVDLIKKSVTRINGYHRKSEEEFTDFNYRIFQGSFLNKFKKEYLFIVYSGYYTDQADNGGLTTFIYIFDENYNQISQRFNQSSELDKIEIVGITDIDKDGLDEVFMKSGYSCMGGYEYTLNVFSKDFEKSKLNFRIEFNKDNAGNEGIEYINSISEYKVEDSRIIFDTRLDYYICMGWKDNRYIKSEMKKDIYEYKNEIFRHIIDNDNVNWNDPKLEF